MKRLYILPVLALLLSGCVDDEGNYDYAELNEVKLENMESSYSAISQIDRVKISPKISSTFYGDDLSNFEFKWTICTDMIHHNHILISTEKDLDWLAEIEPGSYYLYFTIKDKTTGFEDQYYTGLGISSPFTTGFLVLGDLVGENRSALDMIAMPAGRDTMMVEDAFDGKQVNLTGAQKVIFAGQHYSGADGHKQALWLLTDNQSYRLGSGSVFDFRGEFNDLGIIEVDYPVAKPAKMVDMFPHQTISYNMPYNASQTYRGYLTEDVVVMAQVMMAEYYAEPANRYSKTSATLFKPAPYIFYKGADRSAYNTCVVYDMDDDCFARVEPMSGYSTKLSDKDTDPWKFDAKSEGRKLFYGENTFNNVSYAIMTDAEGNYFIYGFTPPTSAYGNASKQQLVTVDKSIATDFDKASHYMFAATRTAIFYSVGSRLYQYDWARKMISHIDFDAEITMIKPEFISTNSNYLYLVATYSDQNKGMIYKMERSDDPNTLVFNHVKNQQWPTRLKVKDIEWKNAN